MIIAETDFLARNVPVGLIIYDAFYFLCLSSIGKSLISTIIVCYSREVIFRFSQKRLKVKRKKKKNSKIII